MTEPLRCLPLCARLLPRHLPKTLPQQERQQFYRSRKLVGEMKRLQSAHVSLIICGLLRSRLTPQTHKRWERRGCGRAASRRGRQLLYFSKNAASASDRSGKRR